MKEAIVKASGRREIIFPDMYLKKEPGRSTGKPIFIVERTAKKILEEELGVKEFHVSISHEKEFSVAFVLLGL